MDLLSAALNGGDVQPDQIGIITPYAAQARLFRTYLGIDGKPERGVKVPEVSSVDGFQGREKDLIFISTVRANLQGKVGFMGDPRRLNVMLTRAKRGLVVVGDFQTLAADTDGWRPWLSWVQERGLIVGCAATAPAQKQELLKLDELGPAALLAATTAAPDRASGGLAAAAAEEEAAKAAEQAAAKGQPRQRRKSLLMQVREEAAQAAEKEAAKATE